MPYPSHGVLGTSGYRFSIAVYTGLPAVEWLGLFVARHMAQLLQYLSRMA